MDSGRGFLQPSQAPATGCQFFCFSVIHETFGFQALSSLICPSSSPASSWVLEQGSCPLGTLIARILIQWWKHCPEAVPSLSTEGTDGLTGDVTFGLVAVATGYPEHSPDWNVGLSLLPRSWLGEEHRESRHHLTQGYRCHTHPTAALQNLPLHIKKQAPSW